MERSGSIHKWVDSAVMVVAAATVLWALTLRPFVASPDPPVGPQVRDVSGSIAGERLKIGKGAPWESGRVVVVEAVDYECQACRWFEETVFPDLERELAQEVTFAYLNLPLEGIHPHALDAAFATECAAAQGAFPVMHERLFAQPLRDADSSVYAQQVGLDLDAFRTCLSAEATRAAIEADIATVRGLIGRLGTPTFLLGRARGDGGVDVERGFEGVPSPALVRAEVQRFGGMRPSD